MGIAIALAYWWALAAACVVALAASIVPMRAACKAPAIRSGLAAAAYVGGIALTTTLTVAIAWWYAKHGKGWDVVMLPLAISLVIPACAGTVFLLIGWARGSRSLHYLSSGAFHATLAVPFAAWWMWTNYGTSVDKPAFDRLCAGAHVAVREKIEPPVSVALLPDSFYSSARRNPDRQSVRASLLLSSSLDFVEARVPQGTGKDYRVRVTRTPGSSAAGVSEVGIDMMTAPYEVVVMHEPVGHAFARHVTGERIEVRKTTTKRIIGVAVYYWHRQNGWECPSGIGQGAFVRDFIADTLGVRK
jgi:hypothetical protein